MPRGTCQCSAVFLLTTKNKMDILSSLSQPWKHSFLRGQLRGAVGGDGNGRKEKNIQHGWDLVASFLAKTCRGSAQPAPARGRAACGCPAVTSWAAAGWQWGGSGVGELSENSANSPVGRGGRCLSGASGKRSALVQLLHRRC